MDILTDGIDKLGVLFGGVCVIHAEVAKSVIFLCGTEIYYKRLAMPYVKITVGLGRKTCVYLHSGICREIGIYCVKNKIAGFLFHYAIVSLNSLILLITQSLPSMFITVYRSGEFSLPVTATRINDEISATLPANFSGVCLYSFISAA